MRTIIVLCQPTQREIKLALAMLPGLSRQSLGQNNISIEKLLTNIITYGTSGYKPMKYPVDFDYKLHRRTDLRVL